VACIRHTVYSQLGAASGWLLIAAPDFFVELMNTLADGNLTAYQKAVAGRKESTVQKHVAILEKVAEENGGVLPTFKELNARGYFTSYSKMLEFPAYFAHIPRAMENNQKAVKVLPPTVADMQVLKPATNQRALSDFNVKGAYFHPTELKIEDGLAEDDWMELGKTLALVTESSHWWCGDFLNYGFRMYGHKVTMNLAEQCTGWSHTTLRTCANVAGKFAPERRVEAVSFFHHHHVARFKPELADRLLAEAAELGLTARQIQAAGQLEEGKKNRFEQVNVNVTFFRDTHDRLKVRAGKHNLNWFISNIVLSWLDGEVWGGNGGGGTDNEGAHWSGTENRKPKFVLAGDCDE